MLFTDLSTNRCVLAISFLRPLASIAPPFQRQQANIDAQQRLGNLIMQVAADPLSFVLLRRQKLVGQALQMFLQAA